MPMRATRLLKNRNTTEGMVPRFWGTLRPTIDRTYSREGSDQSSWVGAGRLESAKKVSAEENKSEASFVYT